MANSPNDPRENSIMSEDLEVENSIYSFIASLFGSNRSITGNGTRETLRQVGKILPDLNIVEVASGTEVFDWTVPDEWNIKDAWVKDSSGNKVIDFNKSNLHIVNYSIPFNGEVTLTELKKHLFTLPEQPDLIPYVTSYYERKWGFCLPHHDYIKLKDEKYSVKIDSTLEPGFLSFGELIIKGQTEEEILLSTYICHPSMANNELSGPGLTTFIAKHLIEQEKKPRFTYRILFIPETIGAITYLSMHKDEMRKNVVAGYVVTCIGDPGPFSFLQTRRENTLTDRVTVHALKHSGKKYKLYDYLERGSDERQYNFPGIDLPVGSLMRSKYREYPEYHTSADNMDFITKEALGESYHMYLRCLEIIEKNQQYLTTGFCEPRLSKYNLYANRGEKKPDKSVLTILDILNYCDGEHDCLWIADKLNIPVWHLDEYFDVLLKHRLITNIDN